MKLVVVHYHLLPGGVTGVIEQTLGALTAHGHPFSSIRVVTGSRDHVEAFQERVGVPVDILPEIGYRSRERLAELAAPTDVEQSPGPIGQVSSAQVRAGADILAARIALQLVDAYGGTDTVWWVHNPHLGKNPAFTRALYSLVRSHAGAELPAIVCHLHDFPEAGRYGNVRFLHECGVDELYPDDPAFTWLTINTPDLERLQAAGIGPARYLANPVAAAAPTRPAAGNTSLAQRLWREWGTEFPSFGPEYEILLYPVRTIRRKNVLEAAVLTHLRDTPTALVVTLPGVSMAERSYSQMVQHAFAEGLIPGLWGIGTTMAEHGVVLADLVAGCDAIISASVQEGFGYQFVTPLVEGVGLIARRLPVWKDVEPLYDRHPHVLYDTLQVPLVTPSLSGPQALLRFRYQERLERLAAVLPSETVERLTAEVEQMVTAETIDLSYVLPHMQYTILKDIATDAAFRRDVQALNRDLVAGMDLVISSQPAPAIPEVEARFGHTRLAREVASIASDALARDRHAPTPAIRAVGAAEAALMAHHATLQSMRLLFE